MSRNDVLNTPKLTEEDKTEKLENLGIDLERMREILRILQEERGED